MHDPGATALHCVAGRDRTGVLTSMYLLALGADDALTGANMPRIMERMSQTMNPLIERLGVDHDNLDRAGIGEAGMERSMEMLLEHLLETCGYPLAPLRTAGLSDETIAQLRRRALAA